MPRAAKKRGKRPLEEANPSASVNAPKAKRPSLGKGNEKNQEPTSHQSEKDHPNSGSSVSTEHSTKNMAQKSKKTGRGRASNKKIELNWEVPPEDDHTLRGPDGNLQTPSMLPLEAEAAADANLVCQAYTSLDGTPGRMYTLGNDKWRLENHKWLEKNSSKLNGKKYIWKDGLPDGKTTGSRIRDQTWVDYSAVASDQEKRAVKEIDKKLRKDMKPEDNKLFQTEMEKEEKAKHPTDWICMCRPGWDIDDDGEEEPESDNEAGECEDGCAKGNHKGGFLADEFPDHKWIVTKRGQQWFHYWMSEQVKRDQDLFGMYFYNDFTGYGIREVLENQAQCFKMQFIKKVPNVMILWCQFEAMAFFCSCDWMPLWMIDDGEGIADLVQLQGRLVVSFFRFLIQQDLFKNDSRLRNLGLIVALWIRYFEEQTHPDLDPSPKRWCREIVQLADEHSVQIYGPSEIAEILEKIKDDESDEKDSSASDEDSDDEYAIKVARRDETPTRKWGLIRHFSLYAKRYCRYLIQNGKIGGGGYDITQMPEADRKRANLDS